jgi:hypothetical protein
MVGGGEARGSVRKNRKVVLTPQLNPFLSWRGSFAQDFLRSLEA